MYSCRFVCIGTLSSHGRRRRKGASREDCCREEARTCFPDTFATIPSRQWLTKAQVEQRKKGKKKETSTTKKTKDDDAKDDAANDESAEPASTSGADTSQLPEPNDEAADEEKPDESSPPVTPSLAQQSKIRSTSFRASSISGPPGSLGPFSPDGETAPDIYRKYVARIEELEKENKRLGKDSSDSEKRWQRAEGELADLREADGDTGSTKPDGQTERLVW